jgi:hypothetical protein
MTADPKNAVLKDSEGPKVHSVLGQLTTLQHALFASCDAAQLEDGAVYLAWDPGQGDGVQLTGTVLRVTPGEDDDACLAEAYARGIALPTGQTSDPSLEESLPWVAEIMSAITSGRLSVLEVAAAGAGFTVSFTFTPSESHGR